MDLTQRLMSDDEEEDVPLDKTKPLALLHVFKGPYGPAQDIDVYPGQNIIGRHANCDITLPSQSVSKKHAILDIGPNDHILYDCGSLNKTRRGKVPFPPNLRYALNSGDFLHFADVACQYTILRDAAKTQEKEPAPEENDDDSFVVPGTQAALAIEKTPGAVIRRMVQRAVLARDSGDEDENEEYVRRRLSDERKGFGSPGVDHRTMITFLSPATNTIVPESDEENDTPMSQCRFPSRRSRRDSGTDRHEMSTKREPLVISSQSFVTSPTLSEKKIPIATDPGPSRGGGNFASVPAGIAEKTLRDDKEDPTTAKKENGSDSGLTIIKLAPGEKDEISKETCIKSPKNDTDVGTEPSGEKSNVAKAVSNSNVDVKDDLSASEIDLEETESPRIVPESDSEVSEHEMETESAFFNVRSDTENEDDARASGTGTSTGKTLEIKVHGDSRSREGDAGGKTTEGEVKPAFHMDSDTDVEDEDTSSVKKGMKKRKSTAILSDSDDGADEAGAVKSSASTNVKRTSGVISDSDTDVEEEVVASVKATRRKRNIARVTSDSDTDVEEDGKSRKTGTTLGSGTDAEEKDKSTLKAGAKNEVVELNINSDTDVEDDIGITVGAKSGSISQKTDNSLLGDSETPATSVCVNADSKTSGTNVENATAIGFHMDSDTDTEECVTKSPAAGSGTCVQTANLDINAALEFHRETSKASEDDLNSGPSVERLAAAAEFHMDSDTDVEDDNTLSPVSVKGGQSSAGGDHSASAGGLEVNMDTAGSILATDTSVVVQKQKNVTEEMAAREELTVPEKAKKSEPEGTNYYMCETQCFLDEPEERDSDFPDDAEEATQAFITSTLIEPDPFKRPADPIAALQISPVRVNTSEEEEDENVTAETQPYFETPREECTQESVQAESSETASDTQPLSHHELSQDTQPISQYLAAKLAHETGACVSLKQEVPDGLRAGGAQLKEDVEDGAEVSGDEVATLAYTLAVQDSDGEATQAFNTADDANDQECNESLPNSLSAPENSSATDGQTSEEDNAHPQGFGVPAPVGDETKVFSAEADQWQIRDDKEQEEASCSTSTQAVKTDDTQDESVQLRLSPSLVLTGQEAGDLRCTPPDLNPEKTHEGNESEEGGKQQGQIRDVVESETQNTSREGEDGDTVCRSESQDNVDVDPQPSTSGVSGDSGRKSSATQEVEGGKDITTSEAPRFKTGPDLSLKNMEQSNEWGNNDSAVQDIGTAADLQEDVNDKKSNEKDFKMDMIEPKEEEEMEESSSLSVNGMQSKTIAEATESVEQESEDVASFVAPNAEKEVKLEDEMPEKLTSRAAPRPTRARKEEGPEETPEPAGNVSSTRKTKSTKRDIETNQEHQESKKSGEDSVRRVVSRRTKNNLTGDGVSEQKDDDEKPEEVPVRRPVSRRTRKNSTGEGTSEQNEGKKKPQEVQISRPSVRRTRKNSSEEQASEQKEEPVSRPSVRRTRKNSTGEGTSEQNEGKEKPEEVQVSRPSLRRTRKNSAGEGTREQKEEPVSRPSLRRTRKTSTEEQASEQKEEPVSRPSLRRTRKNSTEEQAGELTEEPVSRPSLRRTRKTSTGEGTSEQKEDKEKPEEVQISRPSVRRTRKNSTESGASVEKLEDNPVSSRVSRRTGKSSALEGTNVEKEDDDRLKENQVDRAVSRRTRKTAEEGSNVQKEDLGKPEEGPARPVSRRGRKNLVEGTNVEKSEERPARPVSRRTRKNPREEEDKDKEHEAVVQTSEIEVEKQTASKQVTGIENRVPIRQAVGTRTRRDLKGVEESELRDPSQKQQRVGKGKVQEEGGKSHSTLESDRKQDDKPGKQTSHRGQKNSREEQKKRLNEASQAEPKVNARSRKATARTKEEETAVLEDVAGGETATTNKELKGESPKGDVTKCPQVTTPLQTRKRGQGQKDGGVEVKRMKSEEGAKAEGGAEEKTSPNPSGKRIQPRRLVAVSAEEDDTEGGSEKRKESLSPVPAPAGRSRQKQSAALSSPAEARTPRRTCRSLVPPGASSPYVPHLGSVPKILFTGVVDAAGEEAIRNLGGDIADSVYDCTHLVTDRVRRTVKFLCALARGVPIVTLDWIEKCKKSGCFLSPDGFLVKDKEQEKSFNFVLSKSLQQAKRKALFEGYGIHVTPNVKPEPEQMKDIIQCSGATFLSRMPRTHKEKCVIVSCQEDSARWKGAPSSVPITSAEFLLSGILRQVVNPDTYLLDAEAKDAAPTPAKRRR